MAIVAIDAIVDLGHRYWCLKKRLDIRIETQCLNAIQNIRKITQACVVVFDVTRPDSFKNVQIWKRDIDTKCGPIPSLLLGNKVGGTIVKLLKNFSFLG